MAIFHFSAKIVSRGCGHSSLAAAAYRAREALYDERTGELHDYSRVKNRALFTGIFVPQDAPEWAQSRASLWGAVEKSERRKDAQLARDFVMALPHEITDQQRQWLVQDFVREQFVRKGYAVDVAIHAPHDEGDTRNHHVHVLVSMRTLGADGFAQIKDRSLNTPDYLRGLRESWARTTNRHLERHGIEARIDHRTLQEQGIDREPELHKGKDATAAQRKGRQTERGDRAEAIMQRNVERAAMDESKQRAVTVAEALLTVKDVEELSALQREHRAILGINQKGRLAIVTDRAQHDLDGGQAEQVWNLLGVQAMPTLKEARRMAGQLERDHTMAQVVAQGLAQSVEAQDNGERFVETLAFHHWRLARDHGDRLYVSDGKWATPLAGMVTTEQQRATVERLDARQQDLPVFDSALDRQERFAQRREDLGMAQLQRVLGRDIDHAVRLVQHPVKRTTKQVGRAADVGSGVVGGALGGVVRVVEPLLGALVDFFAGGSPPPSRAPEQDAPPPVAQAQDQPHAVRIREQARMLSLETPALEPQTEAIRRLSPQALSPEKEANIQRLLQSQAQARAREHYREDGRER